MRSTLRQRVGMRISAMLGTPVNLAVLCSVKAGTVAATNHKERSSYASAHVPERGVRDSTEALRCAALLGHTEVVRLLLDLPAERGVDPTEALRWTALRGHTEVVRLLLDPLAAQEIKFY